MMIAAATEENGMSAVIPDTMERAKGVMLFDLETDDPPRFVTENLAKHIVEAQCEALLCGFIYDTQFFETVAGAGVTRYLAAGLTVEEAVTAMNAYQLNMIPDYVGGPGCSDHGHDHEDCGCEKS
ncbi:hypothetical protein D1641_06920 [Colidextribacter sp. OB.20]|uniref:NifB/NifX family molybdenum-iron cluster-binding protein n=1 Tax=Colidextribacter sp. OB.20 TaxID=2304568 RepID=UPI00137155C9|nr:hypothetical protein [Colidextribacter sp. OB.20]NBI09747.1 hypothetical protein [Colidextribacter sp. OB.20]